MTSEDKRVLLEHMRTPIRCFVALILLLAVNVLLGALLPFRGAWIIEAGVATVMVAVVLLFSMEVVHEPPLVRFFSGLGFFWVAILMGITMVDYLSR